MRGLRLRLIGLLLLTALLPAVPAAWTVSELFRRTLDAGAEEQVLEGARAGLALARDLLEAEKEAFRGAVLDGGLVDTLDAVGLDALDPAERSMLESMGAAHPASGGTIRLLAGPERVTLHGTEQLAARVPGADGAAVWVVRALPDALTGRVDRLAGVIRLVETRKRDREAVVHGLVATFLTVYGLLLVLVAGLGLLVATRLTRPLESLGAGIDLVAAGDLEARVDTGGAGRLAPLLGRFNRMAERLGDQQQELVRLEKLAAWRNLARRLAHEIKNPLTPIRLAVQQMRDAYRGDDPAHRHILDEGAEIVEEEIRALRTLVQEFSEFARLPEPQFREVALEDLLQEAAGGFGADRVAVQTGTAPAADPGAVPADSQLTCDPDQLHRVLLNLLTNALDAQEGAGVSPPVELAAGARAGTVWIEVRDRGPGVAAAERERIFEPDYSTKTVGMGLGLAISREIVRAHGGTLRVRDREGGGAVFRLELPARPRPAAATEDG